MPNATDTVRGSESLWDLALGGTWIDPQAMAAAIVEAMDEPAPDFRTRLLIHESLLALRRKWGEARFQQWVQSTGSSRQIVGLLESQIGPEGFGSLVERIMEPTRVETVQQFLRELGMSIDRPLRITIGGSGALILAGQLSRRTEDIDIVDEVPVEMRSQHELLDQLAQRYGLRLAHFQSHYLPAGWEQRVRSLGVFGRIEVDAVDSYDILLGKLFSTGRRIVTICGHWRRRSTGRR